MKRSFRITGKIFMKAITLIALALLTIFNTFFKVFKVLFQFAATPVAVIGILIVGYECITGVVTTYNIASIFFFIALVAFRYLLNPIADAIDNAISAMKEYFYAPIFIKSPVRYTF